MEVGEPLVHINAIYGAVMGFFMFFTIFVVTNIITGIFVDTAIQSAQNDREEVIQEELHATQHHRVQLKRVFEEADLDRSGTLTVDEFEQHLQDSKVKAHFSSLGLHVDEARGLFRLLDMDRSNEIGIEEFLFGCMRLKGTASGIDLATMMYENKRLVEFVKKFELAVKVSLKDMNSKLEQLTDAQTKQQEMILAGSYPSGVVLGGMLSEVTSTLLEHGPCTKVPLSGKGLPPRI